MVARAHLAEPVMSPVGHVTCSAVSCSLRLDCGLLERHECRTRMRLETKFIRLKTPVTIGSRFGEWRVSWLGGWTRDRLSFLVMLVRVSESDPKKSRCGCHPHARSMIVGLTISALF